MAGCGVTWTGRAATSEGGREGGAAMDVAKVLDDAGVDAVADECMGRLLMVESLGDADAGPVWAEREDWPSNFEDRDNEE